MITKAFCLITWWLATQLLAFYVVCNLNAHPLLEYIDGIDLNTIIHLEGDLELTGTFSPYAIYDSTTGQYCRQLLVNT